ncbi:Outer membrane cobalamin receptor protein [Fodinibius salinus]|uniref:Outer membrane cobalamin receptor protein n=1 Tax=Fodinibius salinus TaxID=860790 RepID=A0A5D3YMC4_9BACT|nr:TonB-dependent receptor [Fodinibius salinus]TYP94997.1 Outer membrane cobalamin receptor protein [Fodinibius salinus]
MFSRPILRISRVFYVAIALALLPVGFTHAQSVLADTLQLDEITVVATRIQQPLEYQPINIELIDSARIGMLENRDIGEILAAESSLFIKQNGPGSFSNASQRGLSSEQIQVLWEGIPINNPMLGQNDLSLLPASFFSDIQVSSGVPSTAFGGGSLSGALYLSSDWEQGSRISLQQSAGSYGQRQTSLNARYNTGLWQVGVRSMLSRSENDFSYYNRAYNREEQRSHNRTERENLMTSVKRKLDKGSLESTFWITDSKNQIPGSVISPSPKARQEDQSLRWLSSYNSRWGKAKISLTNYLERVELNYFDPEIDTHSLSTNRRWLMSADIKFQPSTFVQWKGEVSGGITGVQTNNYTSDKQRQQLSVLANPVIVALDSKLRLYPALRFDAYSDFGSVVSPSLGINYELIEETVFLRGQLSRDFNPPTFNALYWAQSGNPNLEAERSNSFEAGLAVMPSKTSFSFASAQLTAFYSRISDGIRWFPGNNGVYSPSNVEQITSQGLEAQLKNILSFPAGLQISLRQSGSFTSTEITEPRFSGDGAVGHQLRYVPKWKYKASLSIKKGMAKALLQYQWIGRRYTTDTESISNSLDPYQVTDATLQLQKSVGGFRFTARAGINNIFGTNYEIVQWYAMPQRNYNFSLTTTYQF